MKQVVQASTTSTKSLNQGTVTSVSCRGAFTTKLTVVDIHRDDYFNSNKGPVHCPADSSIKHNYFDKHSYSRCFVNYDHYFYNHSMTFELQIY